MSQSTLIEAWTSAAKQGNVRKLREMLNVLQPYESVNDGFGKHGETTLHIVAQFGCNEVVVLLLDRAASVDSLDDDRRTPLHYAAESGDCEVVKMMLDRGALVGAKDASLDTLLHLAARQNEAEAIVEMLVA